MLKEPALVAQEEPMKVSFKLPATAYPKVGGISQYLTLRQKITLLQVQMRLMGKRRQGLTLKHRLVELLLSFFRIPRWALYTYDMVVALLREV